MRYTHRGRRRLYQNGCQRRSAGCRRRELSLRCTASPSTLRYSHSTASSSVSLQVGLHTRDDLTVNTTSTLARTRIAVSNDNVNAPAGDRAVSTMSPVKRRSTLQRGRDDGDFGRNGRRRCCDEGGLCRRTRLRKLDEPST